MLNGGFIASAADAQGGSALAGSIHLNAPLGALALRPNGTGSFTWNINSTITGSGTLQVATYDVSNVRSGFIYLNGDLSAFAGTFYVGVGTTTNASAGNSVFSVTSSAPLATLQLVPDSSPFFVYELSSNVTFAGLTIGNTVLAPGTYNFPQLETYAPGKFLDLGGSITVAAIPEPSTVGLVLGCWPRLPYFLSQEPAPPRRSKRLILRIVFAQNANPEPREVVPGLLLFGDGFVVLELGRFFRGALFLSHARMRIETQRSEGVHRKCGEELGKRHGKRKYYRPVEVRKAAVDLGYPIDWTCWAYCIFSSPGDFRAHDTAGEACDYTKMKTEVLADLSGGSFLGLDIDLSWLEWPDIDLSGIFDWFDWNS